MRSPFVRVAPVVVLVLLFGASGAVDVRANEQASVKIPPNEWGCTLCHAGDGVTPELVPDVVAGELSVFGNQWRAISSVEAGRTWAEMAVVNADGDGCSNGCELDDPEGRYEPGGTSPVRTCAEGDPNVADCTLPLDEESWSTLKALFGDG